jgi:hypothetical protein
MLYLRNLQAVSGREVRMRIAKEFSPGKRRFDKSQKTSQHRGKHRLENLSRESFVRGLHKNGGKLKKPGISNLTQSSMPNHQARWQLIFLKGRFLLPFFLLECAVVVGASTAQEKRILRQPAT